MAVDVIAALIDLGKMKKALQEYPLPGSVTLELLVHEKAIVARSRYQHRPTGVSTYECSMCTYEELAEKGVGPFMNRIMADYQRGIRVIEDQESRQQAKARIRREVQEITAAKMGNCPGTGQAKQRAPGGLAF